METIIGKLEAKNTENGVSKNGKPYTRLVFEVDGRKYATFDTNLGDDVAVGDNVEITLEQQGQYKHPIAIKKSEVEVIQMNKETPNPTKTATRQQRTAEDIGATELLRYTTMIFQSLYKDSDISQDHEEIFATAENLAWNCFDRFRQRLA